MKNILMRCRRERCEVRENLTVLDGYARKGVDSQKNILMRCRRERCEVRQNLTVLDGYAGRGSGWAVREGQCACVSVQDG